MSPTNTTENMYVEELKSLLKDKFFMMLLGISVAIVVLSTVYSFIRPKTENGQIASGEQTSLLPTITSSPSDQDSGRTIAGLEPQISQPVGQVSGTQSSIFDELKSKIKGLTAFNTPETTPSPAPVLSDKEKTSIANPSPTKGGQYTIAEGDSLWQIAEKAYGSGYNYVDIVTANNLINPDYLEVGQVITIPSVEAKTATTGEILAQAPSTKYDDTIPASYTSIEGDSLWSIAVKVYNNGYEWSRIASLNNLSNPDYIQVGQVMRLK